MSDRTNLLFGIIRKSVEAGEAAYAFEGLRIVEEVVILEEAHENEWMFLNLVHSLLNDLAIRSLKINPNIALRIFRVYNTIADRIKRIPTIFVNIGNRIMESVVNLCREVPNTRFLHDFLLQASNMMIYFYKHYVLFDLFIISALSLDSNLREILKLSREISLLDTFPIGFATNQAILELLRNGKNREALHLSELIHGETTASPSVKMSMVGLIIDSKSEGFDDFASESLQLVKNKWVASFEIDVIHDCDFGEGSREISVKPDGSMEIKVGDKGKEEACLWVKEEVEKIG